MLNFKISTQACECHAFDVPSPETHYKAICRSLVEEAMAIHKLGEEIETDKRNEKKVAVRTVTLTVTKAFSGR